MQAIIEDNGGRCDAGTADGAVRLNVGERVFSVSRRGLLHPSVHYRYLPFMLLHLEHQLPKDGQKKAYLEASPDYVQRFTDQLNILESRRITAIEMDEPEIGDPSYSEYHELFMRPIGEDQRQQQQGDGDVQMGEGGGEAGQGEQGSGVDFDSAMEGILTAFEQCKASRAALQK